MHTNIPISNQQPVININQIIVPPRKEFMTINELAEQVPFGKSRIFEMIKSGELLEEKHFTRNGRKLVFYFPEIVAFLKPKQAEV